MQEPSTTWSVSSNKYTILFMVLLSFICALILSILASALSEPQEVAKEIDRSTQMLISAQIISPFGYFQVEKDGKVVPAQFSDGLLTPSDTKIKPTSTQILEVYRSRIHSFLLNNKDELVTFKDAGIDEDKYVSDYRKSGYYLQPFKLIYKITPNTKEPKDEVEGYVIPVNGMGLWDAIYGYLAIKPDGNTVIGTSWYDQKETPGLGANIAEPDWQSQFPGKHIFQESPDGKTDAKTSAIGITVVKGKVKEVYGDSPKAISAVDGMAGATLTGNGVTDAFKNVLSAYRPFLIKQFEKKKA